MRAHAAPCLVTVWDISHVAQGASWMTRTVRQFVASRVGLLPRQTSATINMTAENQSAHFRANLGVLDEDAAQVFSNWAKANCSHHVMKEEDGSKVLYATRANVRSPQQHKNTLRALISRNRIQLKTEASFLQLLTAKEYEEVIAPDSQAAHTNAPEQEAAPPTCCRVQIIAREISADFDRRAKEMLAQLVAGGAR